MTQSEQLSEEYIQNCFHNYLRSSLTQAKVERLLDAEVLRGAEGDLMITGMHQLRSLLKVLTSLSRSCFMSLLCSPPLYNIATIGSPPTTLEEFNSNRSLSHQLSPDLCLVPPRLVRDSSGHPIPYSRAPA